MGVCDWASTGPVWSCVALRSGIRPPAVSSCPRENREHSPAGREHAQRWPNPQAYKVSGHRIIACRAGMDPLFLGCVGHQLALTPHNCKPYTDCRPPYVRARARDGVRVRSTECSVQAGEERRRKREGEKGKKEREKEKKEEKKEKKEERKATATQRNTTQRQKQNTVLVQLGARFGSMGNQHRTERIRGCHVPPDCCPTTVRVLAPLFSPSRIWRCPCWSGRLTASPKIRFVWTAPPTAL